MSKWIVIKFDSVDVSLMMDSQPAFLPGEARRASVVTALDEDSAILEAAGGSEGFFQALPMPETTCPRQARLILGPGFKTDEEAAQ